MLLSSPDWSRIHRKKTFDFWSLFLAVFSIPYGVGSRLRPWSYSRGYFKRQSLPGFVVSIGNLTAGGTGKTPAVAMLAGWAQGKGYRVAVLSRGYGGKYTDKVLEVSDGSSIHVDPHKAGDEPYLLANKLSGVPLILSKKRFYAGLYAHEKFGSDFFILDDGFQHLELKRDLDLVLIDSADPFGNGHLLPWGPLREPLSQLARADVFILTRAKSHGIDDNTRDSLKREFPSTPVFHSDHLPSRIVFPYTKEKHEPGFIKGKSVLAFAGIARPELFRDTLIKLGADVVHFMGYKDHYAFRHEDIQTLIRMKEKVGARYLLTTEKDWMRIASLGPRYSQLGYLSIEFVLLSDHDRFFRIIKDGVNKTHGTEYENTRTGCQ
jgi:tetraacyldisaccharide 4'-kinase